MGAIGGLLGISGGAAGTGFAAPQAANITNPTDATQISNSYTGTQSALQQQQSLLNALQGQNGIQNQSNVYNQLQGVANGTGPNPAQAQLAQATGANTANQAALMAGQRGSGANAGLIARQAAQQGGANQQNAAGQAATLQANQSLNALGQLQNTASNQVANQIAGTGAVTGAQTGEQQSLLNAQQGFNSSQVTNQAGVNSANAALAQTSMQGQQALIGGLTNAAGPAALVAAAAQGGMVKKYATGDLVSADYDNHDQVDYGTGATPMQTPATPMAASIAAPIAPQAPKGPQSSFGKFLSGRGNTTPTAINYGNPGANALAAGVSQAMKGLFSPSAPQSPVATQSQETTSDNYSSPQDPSMLYGAEGGRVPALVAPGEIRLRPNQVQQVLKGADPTKIGEKIKGKAPVPGAVNDYKNDVVRKDLYEGDVIVPNKETKSKNPSEASRRFVHALAAKHGMTVMPKKVK